MSNDYELKGLKIEITPRTEVAGMVLERSNYVFSKDATTYRCNYKNEMDFKNKDNNNKFTSVDSSRFTSPSWSSSRCL